MERWREERVGSKGERGEQRHTQGWLSLLCNTEDWTEDEPLLWHKFIYVVRCAETITHHAVLLCGNSLSGSQLLAQDQSQEENGSLLLTALSLCSLHKVWWATQPYLVTHGSLFLACLALHPCTFLLVVNGRPNAMLTYTCIMMETKHADNSCYYRNANQAKAL